MIEFFKIHKDLIETIAAISTSITFIILIWQIRASKNIEKTKFEDGLTDQYRAIIEKLPVEYILRGDCIPQFEHYELYDFYNETNLQTKREKELVLSCYYKYFDLCNEQVFLMLKGRISNKTCKEWVDGIKNNIKENKNFNKAYSLIVTKNKSYQQKKQHEIYFKELQLIIELYENKNLNFNRINRKIMKFNLRRKFYKENLWLAIWNAR